MNIQYGDLTVGDLGVSIIIRTDQTLSGNIDFVFIKPSDATITRDASSLSGQAATYVTAAGDIDEAGEWRVYLRNVTTGFYFNGDGANSFMVKPDPHNMASEGN